MRGVEPCFVKLIVGVLLMSLNSSSNVAAFESSRAGDADTHSDVPSPLAARLPSHEPYCGVYCLCLAMRSLGHEASMADLVKPRYIGSRSGSSMGDLLRATQDLRLYGEPMKGMTCEMLREATWPIILHVKFDLGRPEYDHWVLFMGSEGGKARVYEGVSTPAVKYWDFAELSARWDGAGLIVSTDPICRTKLLVVGARQFLVHAGIAMCALGGSFSFLRTVRRRSPPEVNARRALHNWTAEACLLACLAVIVGATCSTLNNPGWLSSSTAVASVETAHLSSFLPKINAGGIKLLASTEEVVLVDARPAGDYADGHISGAINIPSTTSLDQYRVLLAGVPADRRLIVYCQSSACPYSDRVAQELYGLGYRNLSIFDGGWTEWIKYRDLPDTTTQDSSHRGPGHVSKEH